MLFVLLCLFSCAHHRITDLSPYAKVNEVTMVIDAPPGRSFTVKAPAQAFTWTPKGKWPGPHRSFVMIVAPPVCATTDENTGEPVIIVSKALSHFADVAPYHGYVAQPTTENELNSFPIMLMVTMINYTVTPPDVDYQTMSLGGPSPAVARFQRVVMEGR